MKTAYVPIVHQFIRLAILLGFTVLIVYLALSGEILLYIAPQLVNYVEAAAVGLCMFTAFQLYLSIRSTIHPEIFCACGHDHDGNGHIHEPPKSVWKNAVIYGLFIAPLLFGVLLPNQALAGSLVKNKGMNLGGVSADSNRVPADLAQLSVSDDPSVIEKFKTDKYNKDYAKLGMLLYKQDSIEMKDEWFIEKLQSLNTFAANFAGKPIKIKGFVYRENDLAANQFIIGRMAMTHCIADISPYGIIAEDPDATQFTNDSWVTITGTISKTTYHNQTVIKIIVQNIEPATAPAIPYVYPDWDFAKKLK